MTERLRLWLERGDGGYFLRDAATEEPVRWEDPRLRVIRVAGTTYLVPEPQNEHDPNAIGIWDDERRLQAGYVPAEIASDLDGSEQAVSLWEFREEGRRVGLRVLVVAADAWVGIPR